MEKYHLHGKRVWVAGHRGMVGSAVMRALAGTGADVLTVDRNALDLRRQADVEAWIGRYRPQVVILAAAKVGGIVANSRYPADFLYDNLAIQLAVMGAAARFGVEKLTFLGSSCIYPKFAEQPIVEEALLTGSLEPTNEWYAIAKIAGLKMTEAFRQQHGLDFISLMPTNLYGPNDNFDLESSHVIPALMRKAHEAKLSSAPAMTVWGSGTPRREFLHVDDLASAVVFLTERYSEAMHINVGTGVDITIRDLATLVCEIVGYKGRLEFDASRPDGTPLKCTDVSRLKSHGWTPSIGLREGLVKTYQWYLDNSHTAPRRVLSSQIV
ncbi:GDP-L-fucose synthase [Bradyrhizobium sp. LHD-71]|uniref:GDP-L-fucose synthase family protein n=1 Tax=Bradyrhizobium sp. LHD-71 TaxID=3072141 RepID=UPI00280EE534|nr:GDP-L-fucose synthase [Bradyrhizobium sp. LHD-71]MDQ8728345.1 GDP-L-fucose synthase [Bradyrhizobium sp. LHD-71]